MKASFSYFPLFTISMLAILASPSSLEGQEALTNISADQRHKEGSEKLAEDQDELAADIQELIDDQTNDKVIDLLKLVEGMMNEAIDSLEEYNTGGETIAAQTEIIEKIFEAAEKKNQSKDSKSETSEAMLDMMKKMMGQGEGEPSSQQGTPPGEGDGSGGQGKEGAGGAAGEPVTGAANGETIERTIPKAAGSTSAIIPSEFRKALDAYNRAVEEKLKDR